MKSLAVAVAVAATSIAAFGAVNVERTLAEKKMTNVSVQPKQIVRLPIGNFGPGDRLVVLIQAGNAVYKDISACIVASEEAARSYQPGFGCEAGVQKGIAPFELKREFTEPSQAYLVLDNSFANLITKKLSVVTVYQKQLSDADLEKIKGPLVGIHNQITRTFKDAEFDLNLKPCGQANAFSETKTANITVCQELFMDLLAKRKGGALIGVILHEYGHSLLNRWGEPGSKEEDMADQFAAAMLLKGGDNGRQALMQWVEWWKEQNSAAEAQSALKYGDTHSLSIQRARNLTNIALYPEDFMRRWNKMLYRHMTTAELDRIIAKPGKTDDPDLAREARAGR